MGRTGGICPDCQQAARKRWRARARRLPALESAPRACCGAQGLRQVYGSSSSMKETAVFIKAQVYDCPRVSALGRERAAIVLHPVRAAGRWPNARLQPRSRSYLPRLLVHNSRAPASRADHVQGSRTTAVRGGIRTRLPATGSWSRLITVRSQVSEPAASPVFVAARKWLGSRKGSPWPSA